MSRAFRSVLCLALVATLAAPGFTSVGRAATPTVIDEDWVPVRTTSSGGHQAVRFRDVPEYYEKISTLLARVPYWKACQSIDTSPCSSATTIEFSSVLQPCASTTQLDCVVEFGTVDANGTRVPAEYTGAFPKTAVNSYTANAALGLPPSGTGGLWTVAASSGAPVVKHYVGAMVHGSTTPGQKVSFSNFYATIAPVEITTFDCESPISQAAGCMPAYVKDGQNSDDPDKVGYVDGFGREQGLDCVMSGNFDAATKKSECARRRKLSKDVTYYLTVRLSQAVSGWMHGRMADPNITIDDVAGATGAVTISISAKPVSVPAVDIEKKFTDLPSALQDAYRETGGWKGGSPSGYGVGAFETDPLKRNKESRPTSFGTNSIAELEGWIPAINDTAIADLSTWAVRTLGSGQLGAAAGCITEKNKVAGIVTTNATVYKAAAPEYDSSTKSLNYTVSAPHYMSSGDLFKGSYSLIIRSDIARCIYKFTSAPIGSTIEVIDTGAESSSVVTNVSETNGWIRLTASGFTHSTPTIRAKMTQTATTTDSNPGTRSVAVGRVVSRATLLAWAGVKAAKSSRVTLSAAKSSKGICSVAGTSVKGIKKGTCSVTVKIQTGTKMTAKSLRFRVS